MTKSAPTQGGATGKSISFTQHGSVDGTAALPQGGYVEIDGSLPSKSKVSYLFNLQGGWILQEVTDSPNPSMGQVGTVEVYRVINGSPDRKVNEYQMSSHTQINEFGVPESGLYRFDLTFTDTTFKGRVRVLFVRSQ